MARGASLEEKLAELSALRGQRPSDAAVVALRKALASRTSLLVAKAAAIAAELRAEALVDAMEGAFRRFLASPAKTDKGCQAKTAIARALHALEADSEDVFLRGIRHVQPEPSFGGPIDTAAELRGVCGHGLVAMNHPEAINELARLLADAEPDARILAARGLAYAGDGRGEPLLRYKILCGDLEPEVFMECLLALLRLAPESVELVAGMLGDPDRAEPAALALGESRIPQALAPLVGACERTVHAGARSALLLAIAALRCQEGLDYLLARLAEAEGAAVEPVLMALATCRFEPAVVERVRRIVDDRHDRALAGAFRAAFG